MSFKPTAAGTYGARRPGAMVRMVNKFTMRTIVRNGGGRLGKVDALVLTTVGRKSGEPRKSPVAWFPGEDGAWLIVASANGAARHPAWYLNLAARPDEATIESGGRTTEVTAEQLDGEEREAAWRRIVAAQAQYARYASRTDRELPVIRLTPRSG
ncbi:MULTISPECIES: nitroreductase family deazaflavin-dependent oxidoreductase [unclassified Streptomyces]|uniref:nitroreductase family deazaflavin-dependent oxidoreductase n=1 Tax=unclassified Streptomyces TaxID=2593676 RepID=UPI0037F79678